MRKVLIAVGVALALLPVSAQASEQRYLAPGELPPQAPAGYTIPAGSDPLPYLGATGRMTPLPHHQWERVTINPDVHLRDSSLLWFQPYGEDGPGQYATTWLLAPGDSAHVFGYEWSQGHPWCYIESYSAEQANFVLTQGLMVTVMGWMPCDALGPQ